MPETDEEYELLPHKLLADLKYDVETLKKKLSQPDSKAQELILEIESLKDSIHELNTVFQRALEEMKEDTNVTATFNTLKEKVQTIVTQNETIARGMVAISDKLEEFMQNQSGGSPSLMKSPMPASMNSPIHHTMGMPNPLTSPSGPARVAPPPAMDFPAPPVPSSDEDLPPPPPGPKKKREGIF